MSPTYLWLKPSFVAAQAHSITTATQHMGTHQIFIDIRRIQMELLPTEGTGRCCDQPHHWYLWHYRHQQGPAVSTSELFQSHLTWLRERMYAPFLSPPGLTRSRPPPHYIWSWESWSGLLTWGYGIWKLEMWYLPLLTTTRIYFQSCSWAWRDAVRV